MEDKIDYIDKRIKAAEKINSLGILTTAHLDPLIAGIDDAESLDILLEKLKKSKIMRLMFSYLLISDEMLNNFYKKLGKEKTEKIKKIYDFSINRKYLPQQEDTYYYSIKKEEKEKSLKKISIKLNKMGFDFVICSLKNISETINYKLDTKNICNGKFYA